MFREFAREDEANSRLNLARREGRLLVVAGELSGLFREALCEVPRIRAPEGFWSLRIGGNGVPSMSLHNEFMIDMALFETPVSGWTCLRTR